MFFCGGSWFWARDEFGEHSDDDEADVCCLSAYRTLFTICGRGKYKAADFRAEVERAAGDVKALLEGTD